MVNSVPEIVVLPRPVQPVERVVVWNDAPLGIMGQSAISNMPGLFLTYAEYRKLELNVIEMRSYNVQLADLVKYYEDQIAIRFPEKTP